MSTPAPEQGDLDRLLTECVETSGRALAEGGEFWPFALALSSEGELVAPSVDPGRRPEPEQVVAMLQDALRAAAGELRATAICSDVKIGIDGRQRDGLRVELEPREGEALLVVVPYGPGPVFEQPMGQRADKQVFPA